MVPNWSGGEIILGEEVSVLRAVLYPGLSSRRATEGLFESGMPPGPQTSGPGGMVCEESGLLSRTISLRQRMAAEKEGGGSALGSRDDTRRDLPLKASVEADLADPGGEGRDDTRQDRAPKAEPAHLCGLWIVPGGDTRQNGPPGGRVLCWDRSQP